MYTKIAAAIIAVILAGITIKLLWVPPKDLWSILRMAHGVFLIGKFSLMLGIALIGAASWLWCTLAKRQSTN
jgi:putative copper export protein